MPRDALQPLSVASIEAVLRGRDTGPFGTQLHYSPQLGSTNDLARQLATEGAPQGTLVITDEQTAGRGRMGRRWHAAPNSALLTSIIFRPTIPPGEANRLVMTCGLAAADAIAAQAGQPIAVKWPNDLLLDGAKVCGILAESALSGERLRYVVVGCGINVNQPGDPSGDLLYPATSLLRATGRPADRLALLADWLERLHYWHGLLESDVLDQAWRARLTTLGQHVTAGEVSGIAESVDRTGALWVRQEGGERVRLAAGEVTLRPPTTP